MLEPTAHSGVTDAGSHIAGEDDSTRAGGQSIPGVDQRLQGRTDARFEFRLRGAAHGNGAARQRRESSAREETPVGQREATRTHRDGDLSCNAHYAARILILFICYSHAPLLILL